MLLSAFALAAAACTDDAAVTTTTTVPTITTGHTTTTTPEAGTPYGGEVVYGLLSEPPTLNVFLQGGDHAVSSIVGAAYLTGVSRIDGNTLERVPDVVTVLPTVANGGVTLGIDDEGAETMTVRYTIREEARWADGVPISGDDFLFTWETIMDPALPTAKAVYEDMDPEAFVVGPKTFEFTVSPPTVQALDLVFNVLIPKHDVEGTDFAEGYHTRMWVSGGPFMFEEWQPASHIRVVRNDAYWRNHAQTGEHLPYLDGVTFRFFGTAASLIDAFAQGDVDVIEPPAEAVESLHVLEPQGARIEVLPGLVWEHLNFSFSENSLVRNPGSYNAHLEYRRAVAHAVDREAIVEEILGGRVGPMHSYVEAFLPAWSQGAWAQYDYDPERARGYLDELCAKDGMDCEARPVTVVFTTTEGNEVRERISGMLAGMFEDVGITYVEELEPRVVFFGDTFDSGAWDVGMWSWHGAPDLAALIGIHSLFHKDRPPRLGVNNYRYGTPAVEDDVDPFNQGPSLLRTANTEQVAVLIDLMEGTVDHDLIVSYLHEIEAILAEDVAIIPLYRHPDAAAVWADAVGGFVHNALTIATWNMAEWHRVDLIG